MALKAKSCGTNKRIVLLIRRRQTEVPRCTHISAGDRTRQPGATCAQFIRVERTANSKQVRKEDWRNTSTKQRRRESKTTQIEVLPLVHVTGSLECILRNMSPQKS